MTKAEEYLNMAKERYAEGEKYRELANSCFKSSDDYKLAYRLESVDRVWILLAVNTEQAEFVTLERYCVTAKTS